MVAIDARIGDRRVRSSGAIIDARAGLVVTSAHTVWGATSLRLTTGLGVLHGRLVARAPCAGLAVIEIQPRIPGLVALPVAGAGSGRHGAALRASAAARDASAAADDPAPDRRDRLDVRRSRTACRRSRRRSGSTRAVVPESSGGPVVNADGELVAWRWRRRQGRAGALAIPWETVKQRLGELRSTNGRSTSAGATYYRCAPQLHAYAQREHPGYRPDDAVINAPVPATRLPGTQTLDSQ